MQAIHYASTFTVDEVPGLVDGWAGVSTTAKLGGFNQVLQSLLDPSSFFHSTAASTINVALVRLTDLRSGENNPGSELAAACRRYQAAAGATAVVLVVVCPENKEDGAYASWISALKDGLRECTKIVLVDELVGLAKEKAAGSDFFDAVSDQLGAIPYTKKGYDCISYYVARGLSYLTRPPLKVIVVDCDNTLWQGQAGDSETAYKELIPNLPLMEALKDRRDRGDVLLVVASKNVEEDVKRAFDYHSWPLFWDDFVLHFVNWERKSVNITDAAAKLNLTLNDSWVFLDDNPVEIAEVASNPSTSPICAVRVPIPQNDFVRNLWPLDHFRENTPGGGVSATTKTDQYRTEFSRQTQLEKAPSFAEFIASLDLEIKIAKAKPENEARVLQLTQKSNQFNFTTKRHLTMPEGLECKVAHVRDRFGDYGLVGVLFYSFEAGALGGNKTLVLDNFVMSCRVLGRGVEHAMLRELAAGGEGEVESVKIQFQNSGKNLPAQKFLRSVSLIAEAAEGDESVLQNAGDTWAETFSGEQVRSVAVFDPDNVNTYGASVNEGGGGATRESSLNSPAKGAAGPSSGVSDAVRSSSFADVDVARASEKGHAAQLFSSGAEGGSRSSSKTGAEMVAAGDITEDALARAIMDAVTVILGAEAGAVFQDEKQDGKRRSLTTLGMDSLLAVRCLGEVARTITKRFAVDIDLVSKVDKYQRNPTVEIWSKLVFEAVQGRLHASAHEELGSEFVQVSKFPYATVPVDPTGKPLPITRGPLDEDGVMFQVQKGTKSAELAPVVFIHPAGGGTRPFHKIWKGLGVERDLYAVEHPFMTHVDYDPRTMSVGECGDLYSDAIIKKLNLQPFESPDGTQSRKWVLCSYSAGGLYCNDTYHQLRKKGVRPSLVLGLDFIHKPLPHCPLYCPSQPCYFPQCCACCWQCFGLQELCVLANCACAYPCMTMINNGYNHDRPGNLEKMPATYNPKPVGNMMPGFMQNGPLLESAYDFFRMGFEDTAVLKDAAPVQQTMKQNKQAKTWDQKVEAVKLRLDEKLTEDGMDENQRKMITTKWERSANVYIHATAPNLLCCQFTPVSYGNTPVADFEIGRQGPGGCCGRMPMRGWYLFNQGGMANNFVGYGMFPVKAVTDPRFKTVFPDGVAMPHMKAHQLVLLDEDWVAWVVPKIQTLFEDLKLDEK